MVGRGGRGVDRAEAVDEHRDALARKAAQHRARSAGREAGRRYARLAGQAIADLAANILRQLFALQHRYIAEDVEAADIGRGDDDRSEEHTSELQSLMRISYAVFCLKKKKQHNTHKQESKLTKNQKHEQT